MTDKEIAAELRSLGKWWGWFRAAGAPERRWALEYEQRRRRGKAVMGKIYEQHRQRQQQEKKTNATFNS